MDAHEVCVCLWARHRTCCGGLRSPLSSLSHTKLLSHFGEAVLIVGLLSLWNCFPRLPKMFSVNEYGRCMLCFRPVVLPWNLSWLCSSELMYEGKYYVIWLKWRIRRINGWITRGQDGERGKSIGLHKLPSMQSPTGKEMTENLSS